MNKHLRLEWTQESGAEIFSRKAPVPIDNSSSAHLTNVDLPHINTIFKVTWSKAMDMFFSLWHCSSESIVYIQNSITPLNCQRSKEHVTLSEDYEAARGRGGDAEKLRRSFEFQSIALVKINRLRVQKHLCGVAMVKLYAFHSKYRIRIRLERASQKQSSDIHKTPYDQVKRCRERKNDINVSETANVVPCLTSSPSAADATGHVHQSNAVSETARFTRTDQRDESTPSWQALYLFIPLEALYLSVCIKSCVICLQEELYCPSTSRVMCVCECVQEVFRQLCLQLEVLKEKNARDGNHVLAGKLSAMQRAATQPTVVAVNHLASSGDIAVSAGDKLLKDVCGNGQSPGVRAGECRAANTPVHSGGVASPRRTSKCNSQQETSSPDSRASRGKHSPKRTRNKNTALFINLDDKKRFTNETLLYWNNGVRFIAVATRFCNPIGSRGLRRHCRCVEQCSAYQIRQLSTQGSAVDQQLTGRGCPMRVFEVNMKRHQNEGVEETGDPEKNPLTNGIPSNKRMEKRDKNWQLSSWSHQCREQNTAYVTMDTRQPPVLPTGILVLATDSLS
ncbi:hypothetical protein PR048_025843 [Dryococelus australis]|uniref:Uncharacterized protein n=1 Tax=Dryococelus australis TaxID=614101 RepID=A0ABQ9GJL3_9NEOP|nr:hypothetical protein PR048_025843 [Dryococelus australis]